MKLALILLFFCPLTAFCECSIVEVLEQIRPQAMWTLRGENYSGLEWIDLKQTKPTENEIITPRPTCRAKYDARLLAKGKARDILKSSTSTQAQKITALILLLDFDR